MQHIAQRLEYVGQQAKFALIKVMTAIDLTADGPIKDCLVDASVRLKKTLNVLQGSEAPTGKRRQLDFDAPVERDDGGDP